MSKAAIDTIRQASGNDSPETGSIGNDTGAGGDTSGETNGANYIDPAAFDGNGPGGSQPRKRGRPKGQAQKREPAAETSEKKSLHLKQLNKVLFSIHGLLARISNNPELVLENPECDIMGDALQEVLSQYKIVTDPKTEAWVNLFMVASAIYGPRMFAIGDRKKKERAAKINSTQNSNASTTQQPPTLQNAA